MSISEMGLLLVVLGFAWNLGAHYTGATMGMPYAARSVTLWPALAIVAVFAFLGAATISGPVEKTVGLRLISDQSVSIVSAIVIVASAGVLTTVFNFLRLPTSTIQILVFCVIGAAIGAGLPVHWITLAKLAAVWVAAPLVAFGLGFLLTRLLDLAVPRHAASEQARRQVEVVDAGSAARGGVAAWLPGASLGLPSEVRRAAESELSGHPRVAVEALRLLPVLLIAVGVGASFVMGGNDVANATGALILVHLFSTHAAGAIGGAAMFVGALTWGRRILQRVAFDVVEMDLAMASAAQGVQALVVLLAVSQGLFTSMNQALIAAMAGTGLARGRDTVKRRQLYGILRGWFIGPGAGFLLAYLTELLARGLGA